MAKRKPSQLSSDDDETYTPHQRGSLKTRIRASSVKKANNFADPSSSRHAKETTKSATLHSRTLHSLTDPETIRGDLLKWYSTVHENRGMPWRKPFDPSLDADGRAQRAYEVWISEIMLQQTQVATVIPYYNRWMEKFPTIRDLAASDIETVNGLWKGLGYYSRAARLLQGAKKVVEKLNGRLPDNAKDLEANIPGIGRYSSGAIASIAYNECAPVLDGNVHRLMSRVLALHAPPKAKATLDILWDAADLMVQGSSHPGDLNQAMIELGSTVCRVRDPACPTCPIQRNCRVYQVASTKAPMFAPPQDIEDSCTLCEPLTVCHISSFPMKAERKRPREEMDAVSVVEWCSGAQRWFLLVRRPDEGLLPGLYEFPTQYNVSPETTTSELAKIPYILLNTLLVAGVSEQGSKASAHVPDSVRIRQIRRGGDVVHVFSHIRKTFRIQWVVLEGGAVPPQLASESPVPGIEKGRERAPNNFQNEGAGSRPVDKRSMCTSSKWVPLQEVAKENMGTGVFKVWAQTKMLWTE